MEREQRVQRVLQEGKPKREVLPIKRVIRAFTENAAISTTVEYHPEYVDTLVDAVKNGLILDYMGSHTAWADIVLLSYVSREGIGLANEYLPKEKQIKGAASPFSKTITGKQGKALNIMFNAALPTLTTNRICPVFTATYGDIATRGEQKNAQEFMADMYAMMSEGYSAIAVLPEGSVEGGRKEKDGKRKGMQLVQEGAAASAVLLAKRLRHPGVLYIPVGIEGGWKINDPTKLFKLPTLEGLKAGFLMKKGVSTVRVGKPIRSDSPEIAEMIRQRERDALDDMIGFAIAAEISPNMRGAYTNSETLIEAKLKRAQERQPK